VVAVLHAISVKPPAQAMSPSSSEPPEPHPLQPILDDAEDELRRRLREACVAEAKGVSTESTQEIRHLEDALLAAAIAAKQTIAVRRHMKRNAPEERERPITINEAADRKTEADSQAEEGLDDSVAHEQGERPDTRVREFTDDRGRAWRAWPVIPGLTRASAAGRGFLGDFRDGWICFEGLDTPARRRLPRRQANWADLTDDQLQNLLGQAIDAPGRDMPGRDMPGRESHRKDKS
jgi:hypothetical protein